MKALPPFLDFPTFLVVSEPDTAAGGAGGGGGGGGGEDGDGTKTRLNVAELSPPAAAALALSRRSLAAPALTVIVTVPERTIPLIATW